MKSFVYLALLPIVLFSSCASLNQSINYEEDDIYFSDDFQHRFNRAALMNNTDVAMPDSAIEYFNESYAQTIRPNYMYRLNQMDNLDSDTSSTYAGDDYYSAQEEQQANRNRWNTNVALGVGVGSYYGYNAYYSPYYTNYAYGRYYQPRRSVVVPKQNETPTYKPYFSSGNNRNTNPTINTRPSTSTATKTTPYTNPNANYRTGNNSNSGYKTRTPQTNTSYPSYNGGSRGGSYSTGGTVRGYYRR